MDTKKARKGNAGRKEQRGKDTKKYRVNMPKKLGLAPGKKYHFIETEKGYTLNISPGLYIGFPKIIIENTPKLYTLIEKGVHHG